MHSLDVFKSRKHSLIKLGKDEYKVPNEFTVEEVERLLEFRAEQEALEGEEVADKLKQLDKFWAIVFNQLEIIFQHYQPETTADYLRSVVTHNEALEMLGFFEKYRHQAIKEINDSSKDEEPKKKELTAKKELRDLRRLVTFMVANGFSLFDIRKLYIDEMYFYYDELIFTLEKEGKLKEGSYAKITVSDTTTNAKETVNQLRRQMFKSIADKNRK